MICCFRVCVIRNVSTLTVCVAVSRPTVSIVVGRVMQVILHEMDIPEFPLSENEKLKEMAKGFRDKSCGNLFT